MGSQVTSPWEAGVQQGVLLGSGSSPLLIVGPVGSLQLECAKEIHRRHNGGGFEHVMCKPDSVEVRVQVLGPTQSTDPDFPYYDQDIPVGAMQRAVGGTLFFDSIDRCSPSDSDWLRALLERRPFMSNGRWVEVDSNTRIIASVTDFWMNQGDLGVPQWLKPFFGRRIVILQPLADRTEDISRTIDWFSWRDLQGGGPQSISWSDEARKLLLDRKWPGNHQELRSVIRSISSSVGIGGEVTLDDCKVHLAKYEDPGMKPIDTYRHQLCQDYAQGLLYVGRSISASEIYNWLEQFPKVSDDRQFNPWLTGLNIIRAVSTKYFFSSDQLHILIRDAYASLCVDLGEKDYLPQARSPRNSQSSPRLNALLVNPLGPVKSTAAAIPHIAHLLGAGTSQKVAPVEGVSKFLKENEHVRLILFCDDFAGTGQQISNQLIDKLAHNGEFRNVCEARSYIGKPVSLCVVLGVAFVEALEKIRTSGPDWLPVLAHAGKCLDDSDKAFSEFSTVFPEPEFRAWSKALVVDKVGKYLSPRWPRGFGDLEAMVITADNAPNDTLPILCRSGSMHGITWKALFERASSPSS